MGPQTRQKLSSPGPNFASTPQARPAPNPLIKQMFKRMHRPSLVAASWLMFSLALPLHAQSPAPDSAAPTPLRLTELFEQPVGRHGLSPSPALRAAHGQRVQLRGYMVAQERPQPGRFMLAARPVALSEHADGDADDLPPHWVLVLLAPAQAGLVVPQRHAPLTLVGTLHYGRQESSDGRVSWLRLQLDADATRVALPPRDGALSHRH